MICAFFCVSIVLIASTVTVLAGLKEKERKNERRSQKIDDLLVLATCEAGILAMLSSEVNGPIVYGSTR